MNNPSQDFVPMHVRTSLNESFYVNGDSILGQLGHLEKWCCSSKAQDIQNMFFEQSTQCTFSYVLKGPYSPFRKFDFLRFDINGQKKYIILWFKWDLNLNLHSIVTKTISWAKFVSKLGVNVKHILIIKKFGAFPAYFSSFLYSCRWLESNRRSLVSKASVLPAVPQQLPYSIIISMIKFFQTMLLFSTWRTTHLIFVIRFDCFDTKIEVFSKLTLWYLRCFWRCL